MTVQFISQDLEWTEGMKECVQKKIIEPLQRHLSSDNFELSVHLGLERKRVQARKPKFEMWIVLQTFDGRNNEVVRSEDDRFLNLVHRVSKQMRTRIDKVHGRRRFLTNPFRRSAVVRTA